jgi:hypothetical protein
MWGLVRTLCRPELAGAFCIRSRQLIEGQFNEGEKRKDNQHCGMAYECEPGSSKMQSSEMRCPADGCRARH